LQDDPWLLLTPEDVDPGGELAAHAAAMLEDPDRAPGKK
jgi:hypothetical protein